jgi:hypothetical protein
VKVRQTPITFRQVETIPDRYLVIGIISSRLQIWDPQSRPLKNFKMWLPITDFASRRLDRGTASFRDTAFLDRKGILTLYHHRLCLHTFQISQSYDREPCMWWWTLSPT